MLLYAISVPILSVIAIIWFLIRYLREKNSLFTVILWTILWIIISFFAIFPSSSSHFARFFGIARGLDFVIIAVFAVLLYTIFKLYYRVDTLQDEVNMIVKEFALSNEISLDEDEDE